MSRSFIFNFFVFIISSFIFIVLFVLGAFCHLFNKRIFDWILDHFRSKIAIFCIPHLDSTPILGDSRQNVAITFDTEKNRMAELQMAKKV